ncbi:sodium:solute symporter family transporter [Rubellicoccus peritrichatus]|uniref:Uncharacterized protein n=1 Tax=Rubellicoccus peritrichatus TaxID=3080537 RepID=A0AAQ3LF36_9BACT|nr:hypothetical protein [Puniceicoccus sp. CR14]WOO43404.1 hypothetical protein RZN69_09915 [Puniceicoccus sp. CR14]
MQTWDWVVVVSYLGVMLSIGMICKALNKDSSDYFRGGGSMLWWMSGLSTIMSSISLWTFSAAGVRVYNTGFFQILTYFMALIGMPLLIFYFAKRFRRMRVITSADAVRRRYGRASEQFWVWVSVPIGIFYSGMALHIIAIFVGAAIGIEIEYTVIALGAVITLMALTGGAWAVSVSDFVQGMITFVVVTIVCVRVFMLPEVGGVTGFFDKLPPEMTDFNLWSRPAIWIPLLVVTAISNLLRVANINDSGSYFLKVKNDREATRQAIMQAFTPFLPLMVFLPIMACTWVIPDLQSALPNLEEKATEGAYVAIAMKVLPTGMLGLLVCAIFAVQMSSLDTGLNKNAGFLVCNFYRDILRPNASEKELVRVGMLFTLLFGILIIVIGLFITKFRTLNIFQFSMLLSTLLQLPMVVPMVMGLVVKRTPGWSAWSTVIIGMGLGFLINFVWLTDATDTQNFAKFLGMNEPLNDIEATDLRFFTGWLAINIISYAWYFSTSLFYKRTSEAFKTEVNAFFEDMRTPIIDIEHGKYDDAQHQAMNLDASQYRIIGLLCMMCGGAIMLGTFIPNTLNDRMLFIYGGGTVVGIGTFLYMRYRRLMTKVKLNNTTQITELATETNE